MNPGVRRKRRCWKQGLPALRTHPLQATGTRTALPLLWGFGKSQTLSEPLVFPPVKEGCCWDREGSGNWAAWCARQAWEEAWTPTCTTAAQVSSWPASHPPAAPHDPLFWPQTASAFVCVGRVLIMNSFCYQIYVFAESLFLLVSVLVISKSLSISSSCQMYWHKGCL